MMNTKKEIIYFSIAGILVGAIDFGTYYFLNQFIFFSFAKAISFTVAGIVAYLLNKYWTFKYNQPASLIEVSRYVLLNFLALEINVLTNQMILHIWPGAFFFAFIIAAMLTSLLTFIGFKWWVFRA